MADRFVISNVGEHTGISDTNGGGGVDTISFASLHDGSGGPVATASAAVLSDNGGFFEVTKAGEFADVIVGHFVRLDISVPLWGQVTSIAGAPDAIVTDITYAGGESPADFVVGGFFASVNTPDDEGIVAAGDTVDIVTGTYSLGVDWATTNGGASSDIIYKAIDSDGDDIVAERTLQGSVKTGPLDTTNMAKINCLTNRFIDVGVHNIFSGLSIYGSRNIALARPNGNDYFSMYNCSVLNTGTGASATAVLGDNWTRFINCDLESESVNLTVPVVDIDVYTTMSGCRIKSVADSGVCVKCDNATSIGNNIFIGNGNNVAIQATNTILTDIKHNTFYNFDVVIQPIDSTAIQWVITDNLTVACTYFVKTAVAYDLYVISCNNCITTETIEANRYSSTTDEILGIVGANDIYPAETESTIFEDAAGGDFRLLGSFTDANQVSLLGNTCGAINAADYPDVGNVTQDDTTNGATGTYHETLVTEVQSGVTFGASQALTGTFTTATPATPTFTIATGSNAFTATIDGDAGTTNYLVYKTTSDSAWTAGGNRSGDGDITVSSLSDDVPYTVVVYSVTSSSNSEPGIAQTVSFTADSDNIWDDAAESTVTPFFNIYKKPVTYLASGGGSRAINALIEYMQDEAIGPHGSSPFAKVTVHNDSTTGIARAEIIRGRDKLTMPMRNGASRDSVIRDILSTDAAWIVLEMA